MTVEEEAGGRFCSKNQNITNSFAVPWHIKCAKKG